MFVGGGDNDDDGDDFVGDDDDDDGGGGGGNDDRQEPSGLECVLKPEYIMASQGFCAGWSKAAPRTWDL